MVSFLLGSTLLAIGVIALLLYPLLRRQTEASDKDPALAAYRTRLAELEREHADGLLNEDELREVIDELERELLRTRTSPPDGTRSGSIRPPSRSPVLALVLALAVVAGTGLLYGVTGKPGMLRSAGSETLSRERMEQLRDQPVEARIEALEQWLDRNPDSVRGWSLLGQSYREDESYGDAANAFARARSAGADDGWVIARQAEALLLANDRRFTRGVRRLLDEALEQDPNNGLALMLSGQAALVEGDPESAVDYWQRLVDLLPEENAQRARIEQLVERVGEEARAGAGAEADSGQGDTPGDVRLDVHVSLADSLDDEARSEDTVFVYARASGDDRPPLAVTRTRVDALPTRIVLDDSQAMTPDARLSQADEVVITARVSRSGEAMPQSGDLEGSSDAVAVDGETAVEVVIDRRLP